jgi:hypothetical protein
MTCIEHKVHYSTLRDVILSFSSFLLNKSLHEYLELHKITRTR